LVIKPNQPENYAQIAALQLDSKQVDEALKTLATWKEKFPTDFRVPYFTGLIQTDRKQYAAAVASFEDAETLARESPEDSKLSSKFYFCLRRRLRTRRRRGQGRHALSQMPRARSRGPHRRQLPRLHVGR
jgi:tetratricopeptide (TPR) repeat protein